jgi:hypothetical protein
MDEMKMNVHITSALHLRSKSGGKELLQGKKPERNGHMAGKRLILIPNEWSDA